MRLLRLNMAMLALALTRLFLPEPVADVDNSAMPLHPPAQPAGPFPQCGNFAVWSDV